MSRADIDKLCEASSTDFYTSLSEASRARADELMANGLSFSKGTGCLLSLSGAPIEGAHLSALLDKSLADKCAGPVSPAAGDGPLASSNPGQEGAPSLPLPAAAPKPTPSHHSVGSQQQQPLTAPLETKGSKEGAERPPSPSPPPLQPLAPQPPLAVPSSPAPQSSDPDPDPDSDPVTGQGNLSPHIDWLAHRDGCRLTADG